MEVGDLTCKSCGEISSEYDDAVHCNNIDCWTPYCGDCGYIQGEEYGFDSIAQPRECDECTDSLVRDSELLEHVLLKLKTTKEHLIEELMIERANARDNSLKDA